MTDAHNYVNPAVTKAADANHSDIKNPGYDGVIFLINVTAVDTADANETYKFIVQGKDDLSDTYYTLLDSGDVAGDGATLHVLEVDPRLPVAANLAAAKLLPDKLRLRLDVEGTTPSITYTVRVVFV